MSAPIVTGLMAYGMSGRIFQAPFLSTHPGFKLKAVVERSRKIMAGTYPGIVSYNTVDELLNDPEIELIVVNTPGYTHFDFARQALKAGKHVLIEKPVAATTAEFKALYDLSRETGNHVMVYQNRRWDSDFLAVKQVIESGRLGNLIEVNFRYDRYKPELSPKKFKEDATLPPNGLVYDLGPHLIDQAISLFGRPLSFRKITAIHRENSEVIDYFSFQLTYPNQLNVNLTSGLLIAGPLPSFVVHGTLGSFIKNRCDVQEEQLDKNMKPTDPAYGQEPAGCEGKLILADLDDKKHTEQITSLKGDYTHLFEAVYQTIRNNALYPITEEHIAWQMELLEAE
ncbi:Gfo/Idh/MocA family oxidoreductase [Mucilaginibacter boryungensis]|uniref:Gfo/Idh/MocA family oxidoreductase n=1 Tax=Mucilaginibacter boryungensis TaxID=768480 RepID=A0ABR9XNU9_9SPHI|nr:Gfo/Idh/MocA family oxidoreductase [Mucilaginibacter boryungensis]MBE9668809.1 Gfo/Idh/MocA family oxidoreductase [Mucilaginibacter boryungensis]